MLEFLRTAPQEAFPPYPARMTPLELQWCYYARS